MEKMSSRRRKPVPAAWSEWIWDDDSNSYYRARQDDSGEWDYEYKNGPLDSEPVPNYGVSYKSASSTQPLYESGAGMDSYSDQRIPMESSSTWNSNKNYSQSSGSTIRAVNARTRSAIITQSVNGFYRSDRNSDVTSYAQDPRVNASYTSSAPNILATDTYEGTESTEGTECLVSSMAGMRMGEKGKGVSQSPGGMAGYYLLDPSTYPRLSPSDRATNCEEFDTRYKVHHPSGFTVGRVFKTLVPPDSDEVALAEHLSKPSPGRNGEVIIMAVRRFVVVETQQFSDVFTALPIIVYTEQNPLPRDEERNHAIIYTEDTALDRTHKNRRAKQRTPQLRTPLRVVRDTPRDKLDANSKLDYCKPFLIDFDVKVCFLGTVHQVSKKELVRGWRSIVEESEDRVGEEWENAR